MEVRYVVEYLPVGEKCIALCLQLQNIRLGLALVDVVPAAYVEQAVDQNLLLIGDSEQLTYAGIDILG